MLATSHNRTNIKVLYRIPKWVIDSDNWWLIHLGIVKYGWGMFDMPMKLNGETYYRTAEACNIAGTSKNTFLRWVREGLFADVNHRDRRGWRLFTRYDLDRLKKEVNRVE
jgi:hypothetical protein